MARERPSSQPYRRSEQCKSGTFHSRATVRLPDSVPIAPCITEIEPNLFLSNYAAAEQPAILELNRITAVLTLKTSDAYKQQRKDPAFSCLVAEDRHLWVAIGDGEETDMLCFLDQICDFISKMKASPPSQWNGKENTEGNGIKAACGVLVHCQAGVSRSSTVILAYMMRKYRSNKYQVLAYLNLVHKRTNPNPNFKRQLDVWEECEYCVWADEERTVKKEPYVRYCEKYPDVRIRTKVVRRITVFVKNHVKSISVPEARMVGDNISDLYSRALEAQNRRAATNTYARNSQLTHEGNTVDSGQKLHTISAVTTTCREPETTWSRFSVPVTMIPRQSVLESDHALDDIHCQ